jgi:hypothetical protein
MTKDSEPNGSKLCAYDTLNQRLSNCGQQKFARWSAALSEEKRIAEIVTDTEEIKK